MAESLISLANSKIGIDTVARKLNVYLPDYTAISSFKTYCPFGALYHADGGDSKSFRLYTESNTAYCFAGCGHFTPVKLFAYANDLSLEEAAQDLLDEIGYVEETIETRWAKLQETDEKVDTDFLSEALKVFCSRIDKEWELDQFDQEIAFLLNRCLSLLSAVRTEEDAAKWFKAAKYVMKKKLGETNEARQVI